MQLQFDFVVHVANETEQLPPLAITMAMPSQMPNESRAKREKSWEKKKQQREPPRESMDEIHGMGTPRESRMLKSSWQE